MMRSRTPRCDRSRPRRGRSWRPSGRGRLLRHRAFPASARAIYRTSSLKLSGSAELRRETQRRLRSSRSLPDSGSRGCRSQRRRLAVALSRSGVRVANVDSTTLAVLARGGWLSRSPFSATVCGFLPLANWLPGGHAAPWYSAFVAEWLSGSAIVLGMACGAGDRVASNRWALARGARTGDVGLGARPCDGVRAGCSRRSRFCSTASVASLVFSRVPISIDELVQLVQARTFAAGDCGSWPRRRRSSTAS